jgi:large subunit ribosomal protein L18
MNQAKAKNQKRDRRRGKIRAKITGTPERLRLSVFKSNTAIFLQIIDDTTGKTLVSVHTTELKGTEKMKKNEASFAAGKLLAEKAQAKKISLVVFDRGGYRYHGRIKSAADGAREGGLKF